MPFKEVTLVPPSSTDTEAPPEAAVLSVEEPAGYSTQPNFSESTPSDWNEIDTPDPLTQLDNENKNCSIVRNTNFLVSALLSIVLLVVFVSSVIKLKQQGPDMQGSDYVYSWNVLERGIMPFRRYGKRSKPGWATDPKDCVQRCVSENSQNQAIVWLNVSKLRTFINIGNCFCQNTSTCVYNSSYVVPGIGMSVKPLPRKCESYEIKVKDYYDFSGANPETFEGTVHRFDKHYVYISYPTPGTYYSYPHVFGNLSSSDFAFLQAYELSQFKVSTTVLPIPNSYLYADFGLTLNVSLSVEVPGVEAVIELTSLKEDLSYLHPFVAPNFAPLIAPNLAPTYFNSSVPIG